MQYLGLFMENLANAMAAVLANYRIVILLGVLLNYMANISQRCSWANNGECFVEAFLGYAH